MSASKEIKSIGLPSLKYVADKIKVNPNRLHEWYKTRPEKFKAIIHGVKVLRELESEK